MKKTKDTVTGKLYTVYRVMLLLVIIFIVLIAAGSLFSLLRSPESGPLFRLGGTGAGSRGAGNNSAAANSGSGVFNGIGRIRIPVAGRGSAPATLIISISFPYPDSDRPFAEELSSKIAVFRNITSEYFSSLPASALSNFDEENSKSELLRRYNTILRLEKIETLYFSDFIILE